MERYSNQALVTTDVLRLEEPAALVSSLWISVVAALQAKHFMKVEGMVVISKRCRAWVTAWTFGIVPMFWLGHACMIPQVLRNGFLLFTTMFLAISLVAGQRWRWRRRPCVAYRYWSEFFGPCYWAPFFGGPVFTCLDNLRDQKRELREYQDTAADCVHDRRRLSPGVNAAIKYFVQHFLLRHIGNYHL